MKKSMNSIIRNAGIALLIIFAVLLSFFCREIYLQKQQADFNTMLEAANGKYHENVIVLSSTSHDEAKKYTDIFGGKLRITKNGKFATITLPEGTTLSELGESKEYRKYLNKILLDRMDVAFSAETSVTGNEEDVVQVGDIRANFQVNDLMYPQQTYLDYLNIGNVWATNRGLDKKGNKAVVAIIDTGIDTDHPEFIDAEGNSIISTKSYNATTDEVVEMHENDFRIVDDRIGHGTGVAGVIAAQMNGQGIAGIAPDVELLVVKCDTVGDTNEIKSSADVVFGIYYAIEMDVDVINMSLSMDGADSSMQDAIDLAVDSDIVVVAAAGNNNSAKPEYPAAWDTVIAVGALESNSWEKASYSNYGINVDIMAPGTTLSTTIGGEYQTRQGTSLATPQVTAAVAIYKALNPYATFAQVKEDIFAAAVDLGNPGEDNKYGFGALDMEAFILKEKGRITYDYCTEEIEASTQVFVRGHTIQTVPEPERDYIILDDWYYDKAYTRVFDYDQYYSTVFEEDITLYAKWVNEDDEDASVYSYRTLSDGTVQIVSYKGKRRYIQIPETLDGKVVSSIGPNAFYRNTRLREVVFPSGITGILDSAFEECTSLRKITFTGEDLTVIGKSAFTCCEMLRTVDIPDSLITIEGNAFADCYKLADVTISEDSQLNIIGAFAFQNCAISGIYLPRNMSDFTGASVYNCENLSYVEVHPDNTTYTVENDALMCGSLLVYYPMALRGEYVISDDVTTIATYAFAASQTSAITMPDSVTDIAESAFMAAQMLTIRLSENLSVIEKNAFDSCNLLRVQIPAGVTDIKNEAFKNCRVLKSVNFAEESELTFIGDAAFSYCSSLIGLVLPDSLETIGTEGFAYCDSLEKIVIPASVSNIGNRAFMACVAMERVEFQNGGRLTYVPRECFKDCSSLATVSFSDKIQELNTESFANCIALSTLHFSENSALKTVGDSSFINAYSLKEMQLPDGVVSIGEFAYAFSGLTNVHVTASLTTIGQAAFGACDALTEITVSEENANYTAYDNVLFDKDMMTVFCVPASRQGSYTLPSSVKITAPYSFYYDRLLTSVIMPSGLEEIRMNSFYNCEQLIGIDIPASVFNIGRCAFQNCFALRDVSFAEDSILERLGIYTFVNCGFKEITIPASVTGMAQYVFKNCNELTTVTFAENSQLSYVAAYMFHSTKVQHVVFKPGSALTSLQAHAFNGAHKLKTVDFGDAKITNVDNYAFYACYDLESIELPDTVTYIGYYAFAYCSKLQRIDIPSSVDYIGTSAFSSCNQLRVFFKTEQLPKNVQDGWDSGILGYFLNARDMISTDLWDYVITYNDTIELSLYKGTEAELILNEVDGYVVEAVGAGCFRDNKYITTVVLGKGINRIGNYAFAGCVNLTGLNIPESVKKIENYSFYQCPAVITLAEGSQLEVIGDNAFNENPTTQLTLPDTVTSIGSFAFYSSELQILNISENSSLMTIGNKAFMGSQLEEIYLPASLKEVGVEAFKNLSSLKSVSIAEGDVKLKLSNSAFESSGIEQIQIPARVYYIGEYAFGSCMDLLSIDVAQENASYTSLDGVLMDVYGKTLIQYPCGRNGAIQIPASVSVLTYSSFRGAVNLTEVTFEEGSQIRTIGWQTFSGCTSLEKIVIPDSVISIDFYAFENCENLTDVVLGESSQLMGVYEGAFYNCTSLQNILLPDSVIDIGEYAFYHCESLTQIPLTENSAIKGIYSYAFSGCPQISYVPTYSQLIEIGAYAFEGSAVKEFTLPASLIVMDPAAFAGCDQFEAIYCHEDNPEYYSKDGVLYEKGSSASDIDNVAFWPYNKVMIVGDGQTVLYKEDTEILQEFPELQIAIADTVQIIYDEAFRDHSEIRAVTIPESVTGIGQAAFEDCIRLETINLNATHLTAEYSGEAFNDIGTWTPGVTLNIGAGVTNIPEALFADATKLQNMNVAEKSLLTTIGNCAFRGCNGLLNIEIPEQVTFIGTSAFEGCYRVKNINYNAILAADHPFLWNAPAFEEERMPFNACGNQAILTIGSEVTRIPAWMFGGYRSYNIGATDIAELRFEEGSKCTSIGDCAFIQSPSIRKITIPESMVTIGKEAIGYSNNLEAIEFNATTMEDSLQVFSSWFLDYSKPAPVSVTIGAKVTRIPAELFGGINVASVTFEEGAVCQSIGDYAFNGCKALDLVVIPKTVTTLGECALSCGDSTTVIFETDTLPVNTHGSCFNETEYYLNPVKYGRLDNGLSYVVPQNSNAIVVAYRGNETEVVIPAQIEGYPVETLRNTFIGHDQLTRVSIPNSVATIGKRAFLDCTALEQVIIPESVTTIGYEAFKNTGLTSIEFAENITVIDDGAFSGCNGLTSVTIPSWITDLGDSSFADCSNLKEVYYNMEAESDSYLFKNSGNPDNSSVYIGASVKTLRDLTFYGSQFTNVVFAEDSLCQSAYRAFLAMPYLRSVYMDTPNLTEAERMFQSSGDPETGFVVTFGQAVLQIPAEMFTGFSMNNASKVSEVSFEKNSTCREIGARAFNNCTMLQKVTVPDSVETIGDGAFGGCISAVINIEGEALPENLGTNWDAGAVVLHNVKESGISESGFQYYINQNDEAVICRYVGTDTAVIMPAKIQNYPVKSVGHDAFRDNTTVTDVTLPDGIVTVEKRLFSGCTALKSVTIPDSVTVIEENAFSNCSALTSVTFPGNLTEIGDSAFYGCSGLTSVTFPNSLTKIERNAFYGCSSLSVLNLPDQLTTLGEQAFSQCRGLTKVVVPGSVTTIGSNRYQNHIFYGCTGLTTAGPIGSGCSIEFGWVEEIPAYAFAYSPITEITIPEGISSIGAHAFYNAASLESVILPASVTAMENGVFENCEKLTSAGPIGSSCNIEFSWNEEIPISAFSNHTNLSSVILPDSITVIQDYAFQNCSKLKQIDLPEDLIEIGSYAFCGAELEEALLPGNVKIIGSEAFMGCRSLKKIIIPDSVTTIENNAFMSCASLTELVIPGSVTALQTRVISCCDSLKRVEVQSGVEEIFGWCFDSCKALDEVILPDTLTKISSNMFNNCPALKEITIPASVSYVSSFAFYDCDALSKVTFAGNAPGFDSYAFADNTLTIQYPLGNETWTEDIMQNCRGNLTWEAVCLNHDPVDTVVTAPTCTEQGYTTYRCSICGEIIVDSYVEATGHDCETSVTEPTCTEQGYKTYVCTVCGFTYKGDYTEPADHSPVVDEAVEATCSTSGLTEGSHCSVCGEILIQRETIPAKGHTAVIDEAVDATCTETGLTEGKHCSVCDEMLTKQEVIPAKGHTVVIDKAVDATCTESGLTEGRHCSECGEVLVKQGTVPASHTVGTQWNSNWNSHWKICSECEEKADLAAHTPDADQVCTVCGFHLSTPPQMNWFLDRTQKTDSYLWASGTYSKIMEQYGASR